MEEKPTLLFTAQLRQRLAPGAVEPALQVSEVGGIVCLSF